MEFKTMPNIKQCQRWIQSRKRRLLTYHIITTQVKTLGPHLHHTSYQHLRQMNIKANWKVCSTTCNEDTFPKPFLKIFDLIHVPELCCRASVLPKQFLDKGHAGLFATPLPAVVMTGIWNLVMVLAIACLLFAKDTGILIWCLPTNDGRLDASSMSIQGMAHTFMKHSADETRWWQFLEVKVHVISKRIEQRRDIALAWYERGSNGRINGRGVEWKMNNGGESG